MSKENPGCRASIRHPANSENLGLDSPIDILTYGIDSLNMSINVEWKDDSFFSILDQKQVEAKDDPTPIVVEFTDARKVDSWTGQMMPYGRRGYQWVIVGKEYQFCIGNWLTPTTKPSILVEVRSETLWHLGPREAVNRIVSFIDGANGQIESIKPSRVDLCVDALMPARLWNQSLIGHQVTYARKLAVHISHPNILEGISLGKGQVMARMYDKGLEIRERSQKAWMYDVWGIEAVPEGKHAVRIEFQLRREILRELGISNISDLWGSLPNLWAYLTRNWLKFVDRPGEHKDHQRVLGWWSSIQEAFQVDQKPTPLIRCKAISEDQMKHFSQTYGSFTSFVATSMDGEELRLKDDLNFHEGMTRFANMADVMDKTGFSFEEQVLTKRQKKDRCLEKINDAINIRLRLGHPNNLRHIQKNE